MATSAEAQFDDKHYGERRWGRTILSILIALLVALWVAGAILAKVYPSMTGTNKSSPPIPVAPGDVELVFDSTGHDGEGGKVNDQQIVPAMLSLIEKAEQAVILDMFLVNQFTGKAALPSETADTTGQLVDALVQKLTDNPDLWVLFITDPVNSVYQAECPAALKPVVEAGGHIVLTDLRALPESNPLYAHPHRLLRPLLGSIPYLNTPRVEHPFDKDEDKVAWMQILDMLNFKANHRKVLLTCDGDGAWHGLIGSANPHTASSFHDNAAVVLHAGPLGVMRDSELRIAGDSLRKRPELLFSKQNPDQVVARIHGMLEKPVPPAAAEPSPGAMTVRYCTEEAIGVTVDELLRKARQGDTVEILMFYLADPGVQRGLREAAERGAVIRLLLDPNKDAFGREKKGIPNRPLATALHKWAANREADVEIRWADTRGEQMHAKALHVHEKTTDTHTLLIGSANFTSRNLRGKNLESAVVIDNANPLAESWQTFFDKQWNNPDEVTYSVPFERYATEGFGGMLKRIRTAFTNTTGFSTY